jgi:hypothetical protein
MSDMPSVAPSCALELPAIPPLPGVYPRDAIRDPSTIMCIPADPGVVVLATARALTVEAKDDDARSVVSPVMVPVIPLVACPNPALRTVDGSDEEGASDCDENGWTTDEDAEKLRETAKYDADIYHQLGEYMCTDVDLADTPPAGRHLFPPIAAAEPSEMRHRPKRGCVVCWKITRKSCSRCRSARYCSKECQAEAWPLHKDHCNHYRYVKRYLIPEVTD